MILVVAAPRRPGQRRGHDQGRQQGRSSAGTELLAEAGGLLQGRFLLAASPDSRPTLAQRMVASALADQVAAAIAAAVSPPAGRDA